MLKILQLNRILSFCLKCGLLALLFWKVLPLSPGVEVKVTLPWLALAAVVYEIYLVWMLKAVVAILSWSGAISMVGYWMLTSSDSDDSAFDDLLSRARLATNRVPYSMIVLCHFLLALGLTFVFLTIVASNLSDYASFTSFVSILLASIGLAVARWIWPFVFAISLLAAYVAVLLPALVVLVFCNKAMQEKLGKSFGLVLGALFMVALVEFMNNLPANPADMPPEKVPEGLTPQEYYDLGVKYKDVGWPELARESLRMAIKLDEEGEVGSRANVYLQSKLPRYPVDADAARRNIEGYNLMMSGDVKGAKDTFQELIDEFPNFEWPYGNLGSIYVQEKNPENARKLLDRALEINPMYLNGWLHYIDLCELAGDDAKKIECMEKAEEISPDDDLVTIIKRKWISESDSDGDLKEPNGDGPEALLKSIGEAVKVDGNSDVTSGCSTENPAQGKKS